MTTATGKIYSNGLDLDWLREQDDRGFVATWSPCTSCSPS